MAWLVALYVINALVLVYTLTATSETTSPVGFEDFEVPTTEIGREIPVLFGRRKISGMNIVWYGDLRATAIRKSGGK